MKNRGINTVSVHSSKRDLWFLWAGRAGSTESTGSTGGSAAPESTHRELREPWARARGGQCTSVGHWATRCAWYYLFSAFNSVDNGVSLFVKRSAKRSRRFKRDNVATGKKSAATNVFKYYKRSSKQQSDNKLLCILMVLYLWSYVPAQRYSQKACLF